ncbi:hypothetical protein [Embleya sp. NPDC001921]
MTGCSAAVDLADAASADLSRLGNKALYERVDKAIDDIRYVRVTSDLRSAGMTGHADMRLDLKSGDFTSFGKVESYTVETISVGSDMYVKASRAYWQRGLGPGRADLVAALEGKYGHVAADDQARSRMAEASKAANPRTFVHDLPEADRRADTVIKGRRMVVLAESEDDDAALIYIPADGPPLPVEMRAEASETDGDSVSVTWSEYDRPVDIEAPAPDLVVELPILGNVPIPGL